MTLQHRLDDVVIAIVHSLLAQRCSPQRPEEEGLENEVAQRVIEHVGRMPDWTRQGIRALLAVFDRAGRVAFHRAPAEVRARRLDAWRRSPLGPQRDFVRLFESLSVYTWRGLVAAREAQTAGA